MSINNNKKQLKILFIIHYITYVVNFIVILDCEVQHENLRELLYLTWLFRLKKLIYTYF